MGKILCEACRKRCKGDVLKIESKYFHKECFVCHVCRKSLEKGGFFLKGSIYYCPEDYNKNFTTQCFVCKSAVEGEVVSALNYTFHRHCFQCQDCRKVFSPGDRVIMWSETFYCKPCSALLQRPKSGTMVGSSCFSTPGTDDDSVQASSFDTTNGTLDSDRSHKAGPATSAVPGDSSDGGYLSGAESYLTAGRSDSEMPSYNANSQDQCQWLNGVATLPSCSDNESSMELRSRQIQTLDPKQTLDIGQGDGDESCRAAPLPTFRFDRFYRQSYLDLLSRTEPRDRFKWPVSTVAPFSQREKATQNPQQQRPKSSTRWYHLNSAGGSSRQLTFSGIGGSSTRSKPPADIGDQPSLGGQEVNSEDGTAAATIRRLATFPAAQEPPRGQPPPIERDDWPGPAAPAVLMAAKLREKVSPIKGEVSPCGDLSSNQHSSPLHDSGPQSSALAKLLDVSNSKPQHHRRRRRQASAPQPDHDNEENRIINPVSASRSPSARREPATSFLGDASPSRSTGAREETAKPRHPLGYSTDYVNSSMRSCLASPSTYYTGRRVESSGGISCASTYAVAKPGYTGGLLCLSSSTSGRGGDSVDHSGAVWGNSSLPLERCKSDNINTRIGSASTWIDPNNRLCVPDQATHTHHRSYNTLTDSPNPVIRGSTSTWSALTPHHRYLLYGSTPSALACRKKEALPSQRLVPYVELKVSNHCLTKEVNRNTLERYLSEEEFARLFQMDRHTFYRLPEWQRNHMKKTVDLF